MLGTQICWGFGFERDCSSVEVAEVAGSGGRQEMVEGEKKKEEKCQRRKRQGLREKKKDYDVSRITRERRKSWKQIFRPTSVMQVNFGLLFLSLARAAGVGMGWVGDGLGWCWLDG